MIFDQFYEKSGDFSERYSVFESVTEGMRYEFRIDD